MSVGGVVLDSLAARSGDEVLLSCMVAISLNCRVAFLQALQQQQAAAAAVLAAQQQMSSLQQMAPSAPKRAAIDKNGVPVNTAILRLSVLFLPARHKLGVACVSAKCNALEQMLRAQWLRRSMTA